MCLFDVCTTSLEAAKVTAPNLSRVDEFVTYIEETWLVGNMSCQKSSSKCAIAWHCYLCCILVTIQTATNSLYFLVSGALCNRPPPSFCVCKWKASSHQELNLGYLAWATSALLLSLARQPPALIILYSIKQDVQYIDRPGIGWNIVELTAFVFRPCSVWWPGNWGRFVYERHGCYVCSLEAVSEVFINPARFH